MICFVPVLDCTVLPADCNEFTGLLVCKNSLVALLRSRTSGHKSILSLHRDPSAGVVKLGGLGLW